MDKDVKECEEMAVQVSPIVMPAVSPQEAREAWNKYLELKKAIVDTSDVQKIAGKDFLKKSYWRKVERFFNLKLSMRQENRIEKEKQEGQKENIAYSVVYRATAPNNSYCDGDGFCETWEKIRFNCEHNVRATAHTRAKNRAISDLVGGGEVSAEEVSGDYQEQEIQVVPETTRPASAAKGEPDAYGEYPKGATGDEGMREEIRSMILEMSMDNVETAKQMLENFTAFKGKDGTMVAGVTHVKNLKGRRLEVTHSKVKKDYEKNYE